jgi:hypothetical protein
MARHIIEAINIPPIPAKELRSWRTYCLGDDRSIWFYDGNPNNFQEVPTSALSDALATMWTNSEPQLGNYDALYVGCDDGTIWFTDAAQPGNWTRLGEIPQ